jgi:hypothetical protein
VLKSNASAVHRPGGPTMLLDPTIDASLLSERIDMEMIEVPKVF